MNRVLFVGGGLAGLACAALLHELGATPLMGEASGDVGGSVQNDKVDGFRLDRVFWSISTSDREPEDDWTCRAPGLRPFKPGARAHPDGRLQRGIDVSREAGHLVLWTTSCCGRAAVARQPLAPRGDIAAREDHTIEASLRRAGFSRRIIDAFSNSLAVAFFRDGTSALRAECLGSRSDTSRREA